MHGVVSPTWELRPGSLGDLEVWMTAFDIANDADISPWDALLLAVKRRAARVRAVDRIIDTAWDDHRKLCEADPGYGNPEVPNAEVRTWMIESRNEERLMTRAAKMAVDAGVAEAVVRRLELEGQLAVDALMAGLDALDLAPDARVRALSAMHSKLTQMSGSEAQPGLAIEGFFSDPNDDPRKDDDT